MGPERAAARLNLRRRGAGTARGDALRGGDASAPTLSSRMLAPTTRGRSRRSAASRSERKNTHRGNVSDAKMTNGRDVPF